MTIQISVTIWTILCFLALMAVLHFVLFKPMLGLMDKRRRRIEEALAKKKEYEELAIAKEAELARSRERAKEEQKKQVKNRLETIRKEGKATVEAAKVQRLREVEAYRDAVEFDQKNILDTLEAHSMELAVAFAERLIKG